MKVCESESIKVNNSMELLHHFRIISVDIHKLHNNWIHYLNIAEVCYFLLATSTRSFSTNGNKRVSYGQMIKVSTFLFFREFNMRTLIILCLLISAVVVDVTEGVSTESKINK